MPDDTYEDIIVTESQKREIRRKTIIWTGNDEHDLEQICERITTISLSGGLYQVMDAVAYQVANWRQRLEDRSQKYYKNPQQEIEDAKNSILFATDESEFLPL